MPVPLEPESQLSGKWANGIPGPRVSGLSHGSNPGPGHGPLRNKVPVATPAKGHARLSHFLPQTLWKLPGQSVLKSCPRQSISLYLPLCRVHPGHTSEPEFPIQCPGGTPRTQ